MHHICTTKVSDTTNTQLKHRTHNFIPRHVRWSYVSREGSSGHRCDHPCSSLGLWFNFLPETGKPLYPDRVRAICTEQEAFISRCQPEDLQNGGCLSMLDSSTQNVVVFHFSMFSVRPNFPNEEMLFGVTRASYRLMIFDLRRRLVCTCARKHMETCNSV